MDKKRIALIIGFILFSIGMGYALYYVFFRKAPPPETIVSNPDTGGQVGFPNINNGQPVTTPPDGTTLPGSETITDSNNTVPNQIIGQLEQPTFTSERVTKIVDASVRGVSTAGGNGTKFYNTEDGKFYRLDASGVSVPISDQVFFNVQKVTWSPSGNNSILEYPDGSNIFYDFNTKQQVTLPRHWEDFSFSPQGEQVAAKSVGISPENRWLISSAPDGSSVRLLQPLGNNADKVKVDWSPSRQVVALSKTGEPLSDDRQQVLLLGQNQENFKSLIVEGRGLQTKWSKSGSKILHSVYSAASDFKPELWISDGTPDTVGGDRKLLGVKTWASKCAMPDDRFVYCGVPELLDTGAGFAPAVADNTPDRLYKIDTVTGLKTDIPLDDIHTIDTITISEDGQTLYFTDKSQPGMYQVKL